MVRCCCAQSRPPAGISVLVEAKLGEYQSFVARLESGQRRVDLVEFLDLADAVLCGVIRLCTPRALSARATPRSVVTPLVCISLMIGMMFAAKRSALALLAATPSACPVERIVMSLLSCLACA